MLGMRRAASRTRSRTCLRIRKWASIMTMGMKWPLRFALRRIRIWFSRTQSTIWAQTSQSSASSPPFPPSCQLGPFSILSICVASSSKESLTATRPPCPAQKKAPTWSISTSKNYLNSGKTLAAYHSLPGLSVQLTNVKGLSAHLLTSILR